MSWFYSSSGVKSLSELDSLVKDVIIAPDFKTDDFVEFDAKKEHTAMDAHQESPAETPSPFAFDNSWLKGSVKIPLPCDGHKQYETDAPIHY